MPLRAGRFRICVIFSMRSDAELSALATAVCVAGAFPATAVRLDCGVAAPAHGNLERWARQGVLLLNASLTVERDRPASHAKLGWQALTDAIVARVAAAPQPKVFLLWGAHAQARLPVIEAAGVHNHVIASNHPSPLSARRPPVPFVGHRPFSRADAWLRAQGAEAVDWRLDVAA